MSLNVPTAFDGRGYLTVSNIKENLSEKRPSKIAETKACLLEKLRDGNRLRGGKTPSNMKYENAIPEY